MRINGLNNSNQLTNIDKSAGRPLAELLAFIGKGYFHHPWDGARGGLHPHGVGGYHLRKLNKFIKKLKILKSKLNKCIKKLKSKLNTFIHINKF